MLARKPNFLSATRVDPGSGTSVDTTRAPGSERVSTLRFGLQGATPEGFGAFDAWLCGLAPEEGESAAVRQRWLAFVATSDAAASEAIADHATRRLGGRGRVVRASGDGSGDGFRSLARSVIRAAGEVADLTTARDVALAIATAMRASDIGAMIITDREVSRFSLAVASELEVATEGEPAFVLWIAPTASEGTVIGPSASASSSWRAFEVDGRFEREDVVTWWDAARSEPLRSDAFEPGRERPRVQDLERWWRVARSEMSTFRSPDRAAEERSTAAVVLSLVGRAWPLDAISTLDITRSEIDELVAAGVADLRSMDPVPVPWIILRASDVAFDAAEHAALAERASEGLVRSFGNDPWALMHAGELCLRAGNIARGDELALRAIDGATDSDARIDFWARFAGASPAPSPAPDRLLPFVDLALRKGDGDWALRIAKDAVSASSAEERNNAVLLALGRALAVSGDLTAARMTLEKVTSARCDDQASMLTAARACVELAEARYYSSDLAGARASAEEALERASKLASSGPTSSRTVANVRLDARNVLGKLLLAQADFNAAEDHFAGDAFEASLVGQPVSELRARVNRAIAVMSLGRRAEAQALLESVLTEAEAKRELKAIGICLINLAALAIVDRRYGEALELSEHAVDALRRIGDKVALARCVANLADLRTRLGLFEEAEQAVRFGARVLSYGLPPELGSRFALASARVALGKADSQGALRHVTQALAALGTSMSTPASDNALRPRGTVAEDVSVALTLAARIALEDGDTARARVLIDRAAAERAPRRAQAELAVLRGLLARALGEPYGGPATSALAAARDADDDELIRESHFLLYRSACDEGATSVAKHHLDAAISLRDRTAAGVPPALRDTFLRRADLRELDREVSAFGQRLSDAGERVATQSIREGGEYAPETFRAAQPRPSASGRRMVGEDPAIRALLNAIRKVGPSDATVLVHGESGTGKELVAEALHDASSRRTGPLVKVNCAALVETLLLSELFGHEKGAFTGAAGRRRGRFEAAEGGTLFLDEIGDISPRTQVALLRVLQEKTFERVGGTTPIRANVRVVCATHRNLKALVAKGEFREDLYYRLCGVTLEVPALRSRLGDLGELCDAILRRIADERGGAVKRLSPPALSALKTHTWPGNVRELENSLRAASLFAEGDMLEPSDFAENVESLRHISETVELLAVPTTAPVASIGETAPRSTVLSRRGCDIAGPEDAQVDAMRSRSSIGAPTSAGAPSSGVTPAAGAPEAAYAQVRAGVSLHDMKRLIERECIVRALGEASGNITKAAMLLGMKRPRLSQLVKQYGLGSTLDAGDASDDAESGSNLEEEE
ncbi:MAG: sigma 54-interacting transcriptional regulator [Polyangiaceae bacterium]|nr:sigma 54-interacting transcriptional regulator [Polyangiaceae bacterium]